MSGDAWIAVDWGTSHLRAWRMAGRDVVTRLQSAEGMIGLGRDQFAGALERLVGPLDRPIVACGMVGSRQGWAEAPYVPVPCAPPTVRDAARAGPALILPGVKQAQPPEVMRGEETQIAGFLAANPEFDGVVCLPGTHTKWVHVSAGEIVSFRTAMTGEMFALLSDRSVLKHSVGPGWDDAVFLNAVSDTLSNPEKLGTLLFGIRAEGLLNGLDPAKARARLSGLLIGMELAATRPYWLGQTVAIVGAATLSEAYANALREQGCPVQLADGEAMTLAGLCAAYKEVTTS